MTTKNFHGENNPVPIKVGVHALHIIAELKLRVKKLSITKHDRHKRLIQTFEHSIRLIAFIFIMFLILYPSIEAKLVFLRLDCKLF